MIDAKKTSTSVLILSIIVAMFIAFNGLTTNVKIAMIAYAVICFGLIVVITGSRGLNFALVGSPFVGDSLKGLGVGVGFIILNNLNSALSLGAPAALLSLEPAFKFASIVVVAPVAEEFFFRGFLYPFFTNLFGGRRIVGAAVQAMLFAVFHFSVYGGFLGFGYTAGLFVGAFVFGLAMAWLVTPKGKGDSSSLEAAIIAHLVFNAYLLAQQGGLM